MKKLIIVLAMITVGTISLSAESLMGNLFFEFTIDPGLSIKGQDIGLSMGINKEDSWNILAFFSGNFYWTHYYPESADYYYADSKLGINFEKYFYDTFGISVFAGIHRVILDPYGGPDFMCGVGIPILWSYFKITPYAEFLMNDVTNNNFNFGVKFSFRKPSGRR
jgi:hypothetical protein